MPDLAAFQQRLGCQFRDENLLRLALTHPSSTHDYNAATASAETPPAPRSPDNQRLEFLGDSVLGAVLSHALYEKFPTADEGVLTKSRAKLVNSQSLATHARALDLGPYLVLSGGEENTGGRDRASNLADAFEALLGAILLDSGFEIAREFILREFAADFSTFTESSAIENPKGELQELLQARSPRAPEYQLITATGADHDRDFECAVTHEGVELARGRGKSKKAAESDAALVALKKLREEKPV